MARVDLMDRLNAVLPRVNHADWARQVLDVMARICRAESAAVLLEREDALRWLTGDPLSDEVATAIQRAWRLQRTRVLTGTAFTESGPTKGDKSPVRLRLMWMRSAEDGGLDAVYFAGCDLRPLDTCSNRLLRVAALLGRIHSPVGDDQDEDFTKIGYARSSKLIIK